MNRRFLVTAAATATALLGGCYEAQLDASHSGIYSCDATVDCAIGQQCIDGVCISDEDEEGPVVVIESPVQLDIYPQGAGGSIPLRVRGTNLELTADPDGELGTGYLEIQVDGALADTVHEGDLLAGVDVATVPFPLDAGLHHVRVVARRPDGTAFEGEASTDDIGVWIDDGAEHVGILSPAPSTRVPLGQGEELRVEIVSLNFTFVNPGFTAPNDPDQRIGYVNLFIDADVPTCLPSCNFDYQTSITPAGLSRTNRMDAEQGVLLPNGVGAARLQIVAQTLSNQPYYRTNLDEDLVFYQIPIQSVVTVNE